jgi:hypothetical protein
VGVSTGSCSYGKFENVDTTTTTTRNYSFARIFSNSFPSPPLTSCSLR